jgi:antitoxin VapB
MKTAKLFQNGQSQAVRLPKEFRMEGDEVFITRAGSNIVLIPKNRAWQPLIDSLPMFSPDFMRERDQPAHQQRQALDDEVDA